MVEGSTPLLGTRNVDNRGEMPTKVMFQAVITKPYPEHNFDGKISLKRVSMISTTTKNHLIKILMMDII
jgi:hypothetical protein